MCQLDKKKIKVYLTSKAETTFVNYRDKIPPNAKTK